VPYKSPEDMRRYQQAWYLRNKDVHLKRSRARHKRNYVPHPADKPGSKRYEAKIAGFRSGFERTVDTQLKVLGADYSYETMQIPYVLEGTYHPDFYLPEYDIYIEVKGVLDDQDRRKHLAIKRQHPELDIRFVFMNANNKIPRLKSTHGEWASKNGFLWADGKVPEEWVSQLN
jgi:hypothetical protein